MGTNERAWWIVIGIFLGFGLAQVMWIVAT
jgi:hypothetical protein